MSTNIPAGIGAILTIYGSIKLPIYAIDIDTYKILFANDATCAEFGDALGRKCYECFFGRDSKCEDCVECERLKHGEYSMSKRRGMFRSQKYTNVYEGIAKWHDGRFVRVCFAVDATEAAEQVEKAESIRSAFTIYEALIGSSDMLFFVLDSNCCVLYVNEKYQQTTGVRISTGERLPVERLYVKADVDNFYADAYPRVMGGETVQGEVTLIGASGEGIPLRYDAFPVKNEEGEIHAYATIGEDITSEVQIKSTAEWQQAVLKNTTDYVACYDLYNNVTYVNHAMKKITGYSVGIDRASGDFLTPESKEIVYAARMEAYRGVSWTGEASIRTKDGAIIPTLAKLFPIHDAHGRISGIAITMNDISAQVALLQSTQKQLRMQEFTCKFSLPFTQPIGFSTIMQTSLEQLQDYLKTDRICVYDFDREKGRLKCTFEQVRRTQYGTMLGKEYAIEDVAELICALEVSPYTYYRDLAPLLRRLPNIDGNSESKLFLPLIINGASMGYLVLATVDERADWDESDLQLAQMAASIMAGALSVQKNKEELISARSRLQLALSSSKIGAWEMSVADNLVVFDDTVARLFAIEHQSPMPLRDWMDHIAKLISDADMSKYHEYICKNHDSEQYLDNLFEQRLNLPDGSARYTTNSIKPLFSRHGELRHVIGITWDVTQDVEMVAQLKKSMHQAAEASNAKSQFLSRMSHELKTPMNAIIGMTNIASESADIDKINMCLDSIGTSSNQLMGIINDVLDISKIESGCVMLKVEPFSIEVVIKRACLLFARQIVEGGLKLHYDGGESLRRWYLGDETRISQIIQNILSNALKFTPEGGTVYISVDEIDDAGNGDPGLIIVIRDTGIGMSEEQLDRVFNLFEQADNSINRRYGGTGLGLSICKNLVDKMDGTLEVVSELGSGSTFTVMLPLLHADEEEEKQRVEARANTSGARIMIATLDSEITRLFTKLARDLAWELDFVDGITRLGRDYTIRAYEAGRPYDMVFMDVKIITPTVIQRMMDARRMVRSESYIYIADIEEWASFKQNLSEYGGNIAISTPLTATEIYETVNDVLMELGRGGANESQDSDFSGVNILLTEDIEINRMVICSLLEDSKVNIDEAENGRIAVEMFAAQPDKYDMVFMDIHMPEMNGLEAARAIRKLDAPRAATVPIVALTASAFKEDIEACMAADMTDHIAKPVDTEKLISKLRKYVPKKRNS